MKGKWERDTRCAPTFQSMPAFVGVVNFYFVADLLIWTAISTLCTMRMYSLREKDEWMKGEKKASIQHLNARNSTR